MNRRVVYFTNGYLPDREGVSKELSILYSHFGKKFRGEVYLHNLAERWEFNLRRNTVTYPASLLPIGYPFIKYLEKSSKLAHIYGSLTGRLYLKVIKKKPCILTSTSALIKNRLEEYAPAWQAIDIIVLESERDRNTLQAIGVDPEKIFLVYPGVPIRDIQSPPKDTAFTILFASSPIAKDPSSFRRRGVTLLLQLAPILPDCQFIFLWRSRHTGMLYKLLSETGVKNVKVINQIIPNIEEVLKDVHATILSPEHSDECKPCPISLVESLAHGRPLLASNQVGIADLIEQEDCGVIFAPNATEAKKAVRKLQNNYTDYMEKAQPTASKYFSIEKFIHEYERLYSKLGIN